MSLACDLYVAMLAPVMLLQLVAEALHRCHWWASSSDEVPAQTPVVTLRVGPARAVPLTAGGAVLPGGAEAIGPTGSASATALPLSFATVTCTATSWLTSSPESA